MKVLLVTSLLISSTGFAQSLDLQGFKNLLTLRQATLEKVTAGMSKKIVTTTQDGECSFTQTSTQTILRVDGPKMVIHSKEAFAPDATPACQEIGYEAYEEAILFYAEVPTLNDYLTTLDGAAESIKSISKKGELVTMGMRYVETHEDGSTTSENFSVTYDLTKSSFHHLVEETGSSFSTKTLELPAADVYAIDLRNVLFCESNDGEYSDCTEGDFSDILF